MAACRALSSPWVSASGQAPGIGFTLEEAPTPGLPDPLAVFYDQLSAREDVPGITRHRPAFEHGVVGRHAMRLCRNCVCAVRIPKKDIRVLARSDYPLLRHAED